MKKVIKKIYPKPGEIKIKRKFLFFPKTLPIRNNVSIKKESFQVKRWLEYGEIHQEYQVHWDGNDWVDMWWEDIEYNIFLNILYNNKTLKIEK